MKLVTKNGYRFATGMFWQIPNEGKRSINLSKLVKDTKHNMFCQIKTINPTWGFCHKEEMQGEKKVASLGKFIVETSKLSASYANSIICYKFKSTGELDDDGKKLDNDLYGYIVLLNGTICPDEGEYVSTFEMVFESIIQQAKKHEIETLYLPVDVAGRFFNIYEVLSDALNNDDLIAKIISNLNISQKHDLKNFLEQNFPDDNQYLQLINNPLDVNTNIELLKRLSEEEAFKQKLKASREQNLKYLIPNIFTLALSSDEIYWQEPQLKIQYRKSLIQSIQGKINYKYKVCILVVLIYLMGYMGYKIVNKESSLVHPNQPAPVIPKPVAIEPIALINACLVSNDRFFKDLGTWTFTSLKCNSLGAILTFTSDIDTTLSHFENLIGKNDKTIKLNNRVGIYTLNYKISPAPKTNTISKEQILEQLQQASIRYGFKLSLTSSKLNSKTALKSSNKFSIASKQSPVFLFNHGVLNNIKLSDISMSFEKSSGFYSWVLQGEF